ncbi:MAG: DHH family phosphoesterase, partial [Kiritimatiellae bacterium]|nr:DHH family phosphoesterase [Kiritimatiellia bacterium]
MSALGLSPILARVLAARGVAPESVESFFDPALARLARAADLPGVPAAVEAILPFVVSRRKIVVFGDYDADGVCASAIMVRTMRKLGGVAEAFIPERFTEGYGMTDASIARLLGEHPDVALVITVDNGITAPREVESLRARGIAVVVTDHHLPGPELPAPDALVNPRVASAPGCEGLCGAGVAFFLAAALANEAVVRGIYGGGKFAGPLLVLAGLATVADLMPLTDQNRILVAQALAAFRTCAPVGLRELYDRASRRAAPLGSRDFGFMLAPRINAAGRMDTARVAYDLLMTEDREEARQLAVKVDSFNALRKTEEQRVEQAVREQCGGMDGLPAVVARGADWHSGVAGIVAARVMETAHMPVAVVVGDRGSARAPD